MEVDLKLTIDLQGNPIIEIQHHPDNKSIDQKLMKVFIERSKMAGMEIVRSGNLRNHDDDLRPSHTYILRIKNA